MNWVVREAKKFPGFVTECHDTSEDENSKCGSSSSDSNDEAEFSPGGKLLMPRSPDCSDPREESEGGPCQSLLSAEVVRALKWPALWARLQEDGWSWDHGSGLVTTFYLVGCVCSCWVRDGQVVDST